MESHAGLSDKALLDLFRSGEDAAFLGLYERYQRGLKRFLRRYLHSPELAEDLCQQVFLKLWEQRGSDVQILNFGAYLFTMAKRLALDHLKRAATEQAALGIILQNYPVNLHAAEQSLEAKDYLAFIEKVLAGLPEQTRRVFRLCRQQHKTYDEAAAVLGISRNTVKKHMVRTMKVLKDAAENELGRSLIAFLIFIYR